MFAVVEELPFGKRVRAMVDLLPGTLLFRESHLLLVPENEHMKYKQFSPPGNGNEGLSLLQDLSAYFAFRQLTVSKKKAYLDLFGPVNNGRSMDALEYARFASRVDPNLFAYDEISIAVKVMSIFYCNNFSVNENGPFAVYETVFSFLRSKLRMY